MVDCDHNRIYGVCSSASSMGIIVICGVDAVHSSSCVHYGRCVQGRAGKLYRICYEVRSGHVETNAHNLPAVFYHQFHDYSDLFFSSVVSTDYTIWVLRFTADYCPGVHGHLLACENVVAGCDCCECYGRGILWMGGHEEEPESN
ncbi:hypothetical protein SUGI_1197240 [Cryptomeria japonica]|nr:hypothetical protein SUGI_1197240 [Cryptomeria japonica]